jgi:hypothetical protein
VPPTTISRLGAKAVSRQSGCERKVTVPTHPSRPEQPCPGHGRSERVPGQSPDTSTAGLACAGQSRPWPRAARTGRKCGRSPGETYERDRGEGAAVFVGVRPRHPPYNASAFDRTGLSAATGLCGKYGAARSRSPRGNSPSGRQHSGKSDSATGRRYPTDRCGRWSRRSDSCCRFCICMTIYKPYVATRCPQVTRWATSKPA